MGQCGEQDGVTDSLRYFPGLSDFSEHLEGFAKPPECEQGATALEFRMQMTGAGGAGESGRLAEVIRSVFQQCGVVSIQAELVEAEPEAVQLVGSCSAGDRHRQAAVVLGLAD